MNFFLLGHPRGNGIFSNYKGLSIIFSKILDPILCFRKVTIFLIPICIAFSNPKMLGFLFLQKIA